MADGDAPGRDTDLKDFYDLEQAAAAAARWPLLQTVWQMLGGDARVAPVPTSTSAPIRPEPRASDAGDAASVDPFTANGGHVIPPAPPEAAPRKEKPKPAQSLEELFGRMR